MGLLMPVKGKLGALGSHLLLGFRKTERLRTWTVKSIEKMQTELLILLLRRKSRELSKEKIK